MHLTIHPGIIRVSTHSRPKAAARSALHCLRCNMVSTHSRPKAAAVTFRQLLPSLPRFNTQPPEGGCVVRRDREFLSHQFQHTAARRRLHGELYRFYAGTNVSTHSRPKAAASSLANKARSFEVSTHSRPKAAACCFSKLKPATWGFNTQPPEGGCSCVRFI